MKLWGLRAFMGFLVAPGLPGLILYLMGLMFVTSWEAAWGPTILTMIAYLVALVIGVPVYFFCQQKDIHSFHAYLILGALVGLTFYILFFGVWALMSFQSQPEHVLLLLKNSIRSGVIAVAYATLSTMVFWLIAIRRW